LSTGELFIPRRLKPKKEGKSNRVALVLREGSSEKQLYGVLFAVVAAEIAAEGGLAGGTVPQCVTIWMGIWPQ